MHPEPDRLAAFVQGRLAPAEARAVEEHLSDCGECCDVLGQDLSTRLLDSLRRGCSFSQNFLSMDDQAEGLGDQIVKAAEQQTGSSAEGRASQLQLARRLVHLFHPFSGPAGCRARRYFVPNRSCTPLLWAPCRSKCSFQNGIEPTGTV